MNDKIKLESTINKYISGEILFKEFELNFYDLFIESEYLFQSKTEELFSDICEKLDFTSTEQEDVAVDRKYGWITDKEFKPWLINKLEQ